MADARDETLVGPTGQRAQLSLAGERFAVDIDWGTNTERWDQPMDSAEAAAQLYDDYAQRLAAAGFRSAGGPDRPSRLDPDAPRQVAAQLRAEGAPILAALIDADLADDPPALEQALARLESRRTIVQELTCLDQPIVRLGSHLWTFDDDGFGLDAPHEGADPVWARLRETLRRRPARSVRLQCFGPLSPALQAVSAAPLSHLIVSPMRPAPLTASPPAGLLALTGSVGVLRPWLSAPEQLAELEALTLTGDAPLPLDRLAALPRLRHLGVWHGAAQTLVELVRHPLVAGLESLDLWTIRPPSPLAALRERMPELAHLRRLFLGGHLVSDAARADFEGWPGLRFVSHDRRQVLGHDLLRIGYPGGSR